MGHSGNQCRFSSERSEELKGYKVCRKAVLLMPRLVGVRMKPVACCVHDLFLLQLFPRGDGEVPVLDRLGRTRWVDLHCLVPFTRHVARLGHSNREPSVCLTISFMLHGFREARAQQSRV